ncbi:MAG: alpha/beta hydrolase [Phycisphaerae bacterium]|jgi:acetyl esterase/lipase
MKKNLSVLLLLTAMTIAADNQMTPKKYDLWSPEEAAKMNLTNNEPFFEFFSGEVTTKRLPVVLICPGGGYEHLAMFKEGYDFAKFFNQNGYHAAVLRYRLGSEGWHNDAPLKDAQRAVRLLRLNAIELQLDSDSIAVMGFSAGGHLAATLLTKFDTGYLDAKMPVERMSCRPNLGILCYPVITMGEFTHSGSRRQLLGDNPTIDMINLFSAEKNVRRGMPPVFLLHSNDDDIVPVENSLMFFNELRKKKIDVEMHILNIGGHGFGLGVGKVGEKTKGWTDSLRLWLNRQDF